MRTQSIVPNTHIYNAMWNPPEFCITRQCLSTRDRPLRVQSCSPRLVSQLVLPRRTPPSSNPTLDVRSPYFNLMSRIAIDLAPDGLNPLLPPLRLVPVPGRPLQSLRPQTSIDVSLRIVAAARDFVKEALSVAFVENLHYFFAACGGLGRKKI